MNGYPFADVLPTDRADLDRPSSCPFRPKHLYNFNINNGLCFDHVGLLPISNAQSHKFRRTGLAFRHCQIDA